MYHFEIYNDRVIHVHPIHVTQFQGCFTENFVNGRKLILMDANSLPRIGIQDFDHIKVLLM